MESSQESSGDSPPDSPLLVGRDGRRMRGAASTITEECERLFCGTLRAVFLGERKWSVQDSLAMGARNTTPAPNSDYWGKGRGQSFGSTSIESASSGGSGQLRVRDAVMLGLGTPSSMASSDSNGRAFAVADQADYTLVAQYVQVWDYAGGAKFKGFTTVDKAIFIFFDDDVMGRELKQG